MLVIQLMQWGLCTSFPTSIQADAACIEEIRHILARHGKLQRFALHRSYWHFALSFGEMMIEQLDQDVCTQHATVSTLEQIRIGPPPTTGKSFVRACKLFRDN